MRIEYLLASSHVVAKQATQKSLAVTQMWHCKVSENKLVRGARRHFQFLNTGNLHVLTSLTHWNLLIAEADSQLDGCSRHHIREACCLEVS